MTFLLALRLFPHRTNLYRSSLHAGETTRIVVFVDRLRRLAWLVVLARQGRHSKYLEEVEHYCSNQKTGGYYPPIGSRYLLHVKPRLYTKHA